MLSLKDFGGDDLEYRDYLRAAEIARMASVIERTGWTIEEYASSPREKVDELLLSWSKGDALREEARELH